MLDPSLDHSNFQFASTSAIPQSGVNSLHVYPRINMANHQPLQPPDESVIVKAQLAQKHQHTHQPPTPESPTMEEQQSSDESEHPAAERSLPDKNVTEENIDSAYAEFILYCNPSIPHDVETEELKRGFRNPPRSDGNSFSPWTLFNLLQKLENKEIKTWAHLVMELGVEPPDPEKNQSAQKVQQYAVRLKVVPALPQAEL